MKPTADILASIIEEVRPLTSKGIVADYIPALAKVPSDKLGIAVFTNQGEVITAGDAQEGFSIQSISKVLSLTLAMGLYQPDELWSRVGKEPSGQAFNSLIQLEMEQESHVIHLSMPARLWCATCCKVASLHLVSVCWSLYASSAASRKLLMTKSWLLRR